MATIDHAQTTTLTTTHKETIATAPALVTMIETLNPSSVHNTFNQFSNNPGAAPITNPNSEPEQQDQVVPPESTNNNNTDDQQYVRNLDTCSSSSSLSQSSNKTHETIKDQEEESSSENKLESSTELSFTKKDISKSRTQSFQSVLSTASLISLKQQALSSVSNNNSNNSNNNTNQPSENNIVHRQNSIINGNTNIFRSNSTVNNSKNFQSFIQAPVFSSFTNNLKPQGDDIQIGQQLPFDDKPKRKTEEDNKTKVTAAVPTSDVKSNTSSEEESGISPGKLTLKALKKLSLSPRPITHPDDIVPLTSAHPKPSSPNEKENPATIQKKSKPQPQPYQPAEVDLSSFASLTRQPKVNPDKIPSPVTEKSYSRLNKKVSLPRLPEGERIEESNNQPEPERFQPPSTHYRQQNDSNPQPQQHQHVPTQQQGRIPAAVIPPHDMHTRRVPSHTSTNTISPTGSNGNTTITTSPPKESSKPQHSLNHPRVTRQLQQIKGLRNPMYVPCVLRMTNNGVIHSPTQIRSYSNSPEIIVGSESRNSPNIPNNTLDNEPSYITQLQMFGQGDRASSRASIKSVDSTVSIESRGSGMSKQYLSSGGPNKNFDHLLKAPPTRRHWVKDELALKCSIPSCSKVFNFFERRHHCRKCGGIFCKEHTSHLLYINHLAQFTTGGRGTLSKVCDNCIEEYNEFIRKEFGVEVHNSSPSIKVASEPKIDNTIFNNSLSIESNNKNYIRQSYTGPASPQQQIQQQYQQQQQQQQQQQLQPSRSEQLVGSVPANWSWSSF
ncbi:Phosphatidylinositol 3-phosphate-binding protein 2 [Spathaspora sp. JA1]|nr:Phosphatidylinositol 3-phosphate-binding protein 2 [Spathaspora sp. JA1]